MNKKYRPALGTRIVARAYVVKMQRKEETESVTTLWPVVDARIEGIFVGWRTIAQGVTSYVQKAEDDVDWVFMPKLHFEAWLVVTDPRRNSVYVLPSDVTEIGETKLHETKFFLIGEAGKPNSGQMSIGKPPDSLSHKLDGYFRQFVESDWREVGWEEWFLAKEGDK